MPLKEQLYKYDVAILKDYGGIKHKISLHRVLRTTGLEVDEKRNFKPKGTVNNKKLDNNVIRAKSKVFEYAYCNDWEYFVTATINPNKYDRTDLKTYYKDFSQWLRNIGKKHGLKIDYIFIPELHKDGKSWHIHGFIKGLPKEHLKVNENGYLDWLPYKQKFGYISLDEIRNRQKAASYITKYISKNLSDCIGELNAKMYYCSKGLNTARTIKKGTLNSEFSMPDFESEWVKLKWYDSRKTSLESLKKLID